MPWFLAIEGPPLAQCAYLVTRCDVTSDVNFTTCRNFYLQPRPLSVGQYRYLTDDKGLVIKKDHETTTLLREQRIAVTGQLKEEGRGTLKGKTVEQQEVTVELLSHGANDTAVTTQVGPVTDREAANVLQAAIARRAYNVLLSRAR